MEFSWSEAKRKRNIEQHGFDFADATKLFAGPTLTYVDDRFDYAEQRLVTLGLLDATVVSVVHTESEWLIRIISMRKATKREQAIFFKSV